MKIVIQKAAKSENNGDQCFLNLTVCSKEKLSGLEAVVAVSKVSLSVGN